MSEDDAVEIQEELEGLASDTPPVTVPAHLWEQWPGEPLDWYSNFLIYLSMGRGRSVNKAYRLATKVAAKQSDDQQVRMLGEILDELPLPDRSTATWWRRAAQWKWEERAARYDVYVLSQLVPQTVTTIFEVIGEFANVVLTKLKSAELQPESWSEIKGAVETLASYISPDIIQATVTHSRLAELESARVGGDDEDNASEG